MEPGGPYLKAGVGLTRSPKTHAKATRRGFHLQTMLGTCAIVLSFRKKLTYLKTTAGDSRNGELLIYRLPQPSTLSIVVKAPSPNITKTSSIALSRRLRLIHTLYPSIITAPALHARSLTTLSSAELPCIAAQQTPNLGPRRKAPRLRAYLSLEDKHQAGFGKPPPEAH